VRPAATSIVRGVRGLTDLVVLQQQATMHKLLSTIALAATASLTAQSPLSMPFTANNGLSAGACVFFDLNILDPNGVTITALDVNTGTTTVGTVGTVEVYTTPTTYVGSQQIAANWTLAASGGVIAGGNNLPSPTCLGAGAFLAQGSYGIAVRHVGVALRYTNGTGTNQTGSTAEMALTAGQSQATLFSSAPIANRVFNGNIHYNIGNVPGSGCASKSTYGQGCYDGAVTWYEQHASMAAFDFAGAPGAENVVRATSIGTPGYLVATAPTAWFAPTGTQVLNNAATPAAMSDDSMSQPLALPFTFSFPGGSTSVVHAAANGYVVLGATTATTSDFTATVAELLSQPARLCPLWADLQPATNVPVNPASGVYFDVDPSGNTVYVTWLDCADRTGGVPVAGATHINVQCAIHSNGDYEFRYGTITPGANVATNIQGWSRGNTGGGTSRDPGNRDLSAVMPFSTNGPDQTPLAVDSNLPRVGTTLTITTSNIPAAASFTAAMLTFSAVVPGIELSGLGMPNCYQHIAILGVDTLILIGTPSVSRAIPIPPGPGFIGLPLFSQSASFVAGVNPAGIITSNGVGMTIGN
jgi:hypothetical protein